MTRFYLQVFNGSSQEDAIICDLDNPGDLRREALTHASASLFNAEGALAIPSDWHLDAFDEKGALVFRLAYPDNVGVGAHVQAAESGGTALEIL